MLQLQTMMYAQSNVACSYALAEMSYDQKAANCTAVCETSDCVIASRCLLSAIPVAFTTCPEECKTVDDAVG